jgi:hypothetical protein
VKATQALPAEKQVEAFNKKFREYNPEFTGQATPTIEDGAVTELKISGDGVMDIAPVQAFSRLTKFGCHGGKRTCLLSDLSPLVGLPLTYVSIVKTMVNDLSPLKGMQLTSFGCEQSYVDDLSSLAGMPLTMLRLGASRVADLSPLRGMKIEQLTCDTPYVTDLSPLEGMPLREVAFAPRLITRGIGVIRSMKSLKKIGTSGDPKTNLPPDEFWKKYDAGEFGKPEQRVESEKPKVETWQTPEFEAWVKATQALSSAPSTSCLPHRVASSAACFSASRELAALLGLSQRSGVTSKVI